MICLLIVRINRITAFTFFENTKGDAKMPVFKPGVRLANAYRNIMPSYINDQVHILIPGKELTEFTNFTEMRDIYKTEQYS